ncbi:MAG TPA: glycosyltransferase family 2 protein [Acidobacteriota bacterium]|nr:glycosyltransferase family 2 protein [Acidobacteriota bacterium]
MKNPEHSGTPHVSFIVPCYNSRRTIGFTIKAIQKLEFDAPIEVIVVDSSAKPVADWLSSRFPAVKVLTSPERMFPGAARNAGAREARGRYLAFIDADAMPEQYWLDRLHRLTTNDDGIIACSGAITNANPEQFASRVLHWVEFSSFLRGLESGHRPYLSSSNLLISREDFLRTGGFSEDYRMAEDLLFSAKLKEGLHFEGSVGVSHLHRTRWAGVRKHLRALGFWSGRLRSGGVLSESWISRSRGACLLLPFYRTPAIIFRVFRADRSTGAFALIHAPLIFLALIHWTGGYFLGITEGTVEEGDR